jgi:hypothetical protein
LASLDRADARLKAGATMHATQISNHSNQYRFSCLTF